MKSDKTPRLCPECGLPVQRKSPKGRAPVFCTNKHKVAFNNRQTVRGRAIISLAMAWRQQRGKKGVGSTSFKEMCRIIDDFNREDRIAGRPLVTDYVANMQKNDCRSYMERRDWQKERQRKGGKSAAVIAAETAQATTN